MQDPEEHISQRPSPHYNGKVDPDTIEDEYGEEEILPPEVWPANGPSKVLGAGAIAGGVGVVFNVVQAFATSPVVQAASNTKELNIQYAAVGLGCLLVFVNLLISFLAGFMTGKTAIRHRLGFYAGALAAAIIALAGFLVRYIPNYPGNVSPNQATTPGAFAGGLAVSLIFMLIWVLVGGLLGLWGARVATRNSPYYQE